MAKAVNMFVRCKGEELLRLEEEYAYIGRATKRVDGGLSVLAYAPVKPKKKVEPRRKRRDEDEEKPKVDRNQKPKRA